MATFREGLPAWGYRDTIVGMVQNHQVRLVRGGFLRRARLTLSPGGGEGGGILMCLC